MKIKKRTLSFLAYLLGLSVLWMLLVFGLEWEPLLAAVLAYFLALLKLPQLI